mgnify:CR=1 FL=1
MRKLLLSVVFAMVALTTTFAAQLNPFAYNLYVTEDASTGYPRLHFYLNATAKRVRIYVSDGVNEYLLRNYDDGNDRPADGYATSITAQDVENLNLPIEQKLSWRVEVDGTSVTKPTQLNTSYSLWCPQGLAIDKDPNSNYFGRILVSEAMQAVPASGYISSGKGAGLYVFNPNFTTDGVVHKGGNNFTRILAANGYQPWRVKISDDGRIFVSSLDLNGVAVWEVSKDLQTWTPVISGNNDASDYTIKKNGAFFAGPNCAMDVIGSGENLKLLLYSTNNDGIAFHQSGYRLDEYALGTAKTFTGTPKNIINGGKFGVTHNYIDVIYDRAGGYWFGASRGGNAGQPNLVHIKADGSEDYRDESNANYGGGGVLLHNGMLFKGKNNGGVTDGKFGVYTISKNQSTGKLVLTEKYAVTSVGLKRSHNAFAVDYAENLYVVGNDGERIIAFALPYSGTVSTPAASKHSFEITKTSYDHPENHLAPFAYDLRKTIEGDGRTKLHFMLNAHARKVQVVLIDETKEDGDPTKEIILREYPNAKSEYKDFIAYHPQGYGTVITTEDVDTLGLEYGKNYSWRVDVYGKDVATPSCVQSYSFYHPSAIDIDNNPNNLTFGMILSNECMHEVKDQSGYIGSGFGAGLYAFTADFKPIKNGAKPGFNGGITFTTHRSGYSGDKSAVKAYAPRRIRISKDGRIFATSLNTNGTYLWEINPDNLDDWTPVFDYKSTNAEDEILDVNGNFIAGPNIGFDIKGTGDKLQLMMYSVTKQGIDNTVAAGYKCAEYDLGSASKWSTIPSRMWVSGKYAINYLGTQVEYDNEGGIWIASHRNTATETNPGLVHINASRVEDFKKVWSNVQNAGIRYNKDFSKLIIAGISAGTANSTKATIYSVSKDANGKPVLTEELVVDMSHVGNNLNDFAWDYAGNLYACGNSNEKLAVYVMPRKATDVVSTPAREEEMIYFECQPNTTFDVTVATFDAAHGTVEGGGNALPSCEPTTVLAKSNDGYKFVYWKEGDNIVSRDNPYTFDVTHNTQLMAYFEEGAYSVSYWNLFRNGEDIAKESTKFPNTNERLWRLLQNDYYAYCVENDTRGEGLASKLKDRGVIENVRVKFGTSGTVLSETTKLPYKHFVVASSLSNSSAHIDFKDYILNENGYFNWMAQFIIRHYEDYVGNRTKVDPRNAKAADWLYYPWMIINRTDSVYSMTKLTDGTILSSLALNMVNGEYDTYGMEDSWEKEHMYINWTSFIQDSKPKGWRNWYTHIALGLDSTLSYNDPLPVTWNRYECKTFELKDESGNPLSSETYDDLDPSQWHQWTGEPWSYIIWRDGSIDGPVVEHVTRDNMKLYADFGELDIYEDRNNDRTISILERDKNHPTHPRATHSIRVHRPLQAGMYNTICLPFDLDLTNPNQPIKSALEFTGTTTTADGEMMFNFRQVTELQAGMPYLVEPKSEVGYDNVIYGDVVCPQDFEAISHTPEGSAVTFHAVMNPTRLDNYENVYLLVANNRLARSISAGDMLGMRAYFTVNAPAQMPHKTSIAIEKNAPTASESVQASGERSDARKVIYNERIYIIRDGVTYTITGARVK